jgi:hypothetical protein
MARSLDAAKTFSTASTLANVEIDTAVVEDPGFPIGDRLVVLLTLQILRRRSRLLEHLLEPVGPLIPLRPAPHPIAIVEFMREQEALIEHLPQLRRESPLTPRHATRRSPRERQLLNRQTLQKLDLQLLERVLSLVVALADSPAPWAAEHPISLQPVIINQLQNIICSIMVRYLACGNATSIVWVKLILYRGV